MSFDGFLLAFESRDLSQADKRIIIVSCFQFYKTSIFEDKIDKKTIWHLAI